MEEPHNAIKMCFERSRINPRGLRSDNYYSSDRGSWFFLVIGSFIYIYLITGDYNTISDQALILIGIGTATA